MQSDVDDENDEVDDINNDDENINGEMKVEEVEVVKGEVAIVSEGESISKKKKKKKNKKKKNIPDTSASEVESVKVADDKPKDKKKKKKKKKNIADTSASEKESVKGDEKPKDKKKKKNKHKNGQSDTEQEVDSSDANSNIHNKKHHEHQSKKESGSVIEQRRVPKPTLRDGPILEKRGPRTAGKKMDPTTWTREELMEKFERYGTYEVDNKDGSGTIKIENKKILGEETRVLLEMLRRYTEIQNVSIHRCFLKDEVFATINNGLLGLRHLKRLNLQYNILTRTTVELIIESYIRVEKKLISLDMRDNIINDEDGNNLIRSFPTISRLNGIPISDIKVDNGKNHSITLIEHRIKLPEIAVICRMIDICLHINDIDLSMNYIDSDCLKLLASHLEPPIRNIKSIILRLNPLTNNGEDLSGIKYFTDVCKRNQYICHVDVTGGKVPSKFEESIERSCMVNRCIRGQVSGNMFSNFCLSKIVEKVPPLPVSHKETYKFRLQQDPAFMHSPQNPALNQDVTVNENDEIVLPKGMCRLNGKEHRYISMK
jgi:hypothetical protein